VGEVVQISKKEYNKIPYPNVINTNFSQLVDPTTLNQPPSVTVEQFFDNYNTLFFEIPLQGDINSHTYLVQRSGDYLGETFQTNELQVLLDEINDLRQQLLDANTTILNLTSNQA